MRIVGRPERRAKSEDLEQGTSSDNSNGISKAFRPTRDAHRGNRIAAASAR